MPDIMHFFKFASKQPQVFEAVSTAAGIRQWWTSDADIEPRVRGAGEFRFYGGKSIHKVNVAEFESPKRLVWDVVSSFRPEWQGTQIIFDLKSTNDVTELMFAHRGYPKPDENYALCNTGWGIYLGRLKQHLEREHATPS